MEIWREYYNIRRYGNGERNANLNSIAKTLGYKIASQFTGDFQEFTASLPVIIENP